MAEVFVRRLSRWQAERQRESVADLYIAAYHGERARPETLSRERRAFLDGFEEDIQRPGFDMVTAESSSGLVGCAYGYPPGRQGEWWHGFRGAATDGIEELAASGRVFALAQLMVAPSHRRDHIATRLLRRLLERVDADVVTSLVEPANAAVAAAYESWGWTRAGRVAAPTAGAPELEAWSRRARH